MDIYKAMEERHSVRNYTDRRIEGDLLTEIQAEIKMCNDESGLNIQLITDEPIAFGGLMALFGKISGVYKYIALI